jgi:hypothetical protein
LLDANALCRAAKMPFLCYGNEVLEVPQFHPPLFARLQVAGNQAQRIQARCVAFFAASALNETPGRFWICDPTSKVDQFVVSKIDQGRMPQPSDRHCELPTCSWFAFDADSSNTPINLRRLLTVFVITALFVAVLRRSARSRSAL